MNMSSQHDAFAGADGAGVSSFSLPNLPGADFPPVGPKTADAPGGFAAVLVVAIP